MRVRVVVVGAGIAGTALAAALAGSRHEVVVLEQAPGPSPVGAGLVLTPNAVRPLRRLGLGPALDRVAVPIAGRDVLRYDDDLLLGATPRTAPTPSATAPPTSPCCGPTCTRRCWRPRARARCAAGATSPTCWRAATA
ncbi:2-polyprenyl-6-methoxyphenol hydroxylase-like FAD-dependent oxidoreductase [Streptomonospora nanhaiensis]|uniref:2-polyprenyl-6-methoxyphenol hydroxylase-like FAD-dependent oxidoreductase n=1 Tax=Streptomonospora nanhaiensis TaxID=1323731 RepID=A0A853BK14_9ACTN|nr:2-polyprenyl-6-methoxyphenol hydroxylase-like FAD-dependent oxidoreductase [Streptomonospora nanhaiensis]